MVASRLAFIAALASSDIGARFLRSFFESVDSESEAAALASSLTVGTRTIPVTSVL